MKIIRQRNYSKDDSEIKKAGKSVALGFGVSAGSTLLESIGNEIAKGSKEEEKELLEKLIKEAKKKGISVEEAKNMFESSGYKKKGNKIVHGKYDKTSRTIAKGLEEASEGKLVKALKKGKYGKAAISGGLNVAAGIEKAKKEDKGEEEGKMEKLAPYTSAVLSAPENAAKIISRKKAREILKKSGASKKLMRRTKGPDIIGTGGAIISSTAYGLGAGRLMKEGAYRIEKKKLKKEKEL